MTGKLIRAGAVMAVALAGLLAAGPAAATTYCVPDFFAACPDNGSNQILPLQPTPGMKFDAAMNDAAKNSDGIPDTVMLGSGDFLDENNLPHPFGGFQASGSDDLTVIGNGRDQTFVSSARTDNAYVMNLAIGNSRKITVRDLAIVVPASFPDGQGSGVQAEDDNFESVDLINRNPGANGFANLIRGGSLRDVRIYSDNGSQIFQAIRTYTCVNPGSLTVEGLELSNADRGLYADCKMVPYRISRSRFSNTEQALYVGPESFGRIENSVIENGTTRAALEAVNTKKTRPAELEVDHVTMVATGDPSKPAIRAWVVNQIDNDGDVNVTVRNTVAVGFDQAWELGAPVDATIGNVNFTGAYSVFGSTGNETGDVNVDVTDHVQVPFIASPGFVGISDFHLAEGSPLIDAGDPAQALPKKDLDGKKRPVDGDRNGSKIRDIGAFEYQPPPPLPPMKPLIFKLKFKYRYAKGGRLVFLLNRKSKVRAVFTPVPKKTKRGKKRKTVKIVRTFPGGKVKIRLKKRQLGKGRYQLKLTATAGGVKSKPVIRKLRVR